MRLISFQIEHVKSIIDSGKCHLSETDDVVVFAGQNEAGKSAILEGLNYFANGANEKFIKLSKRLNKEPKVSCEFLVEEKDLDAEDARINDILRELKNVNCFRAGTTDEDSKSIFVSDDTVGKIEKLMEKTNFAIESKPEEKQENAVTDATAQEEAIKKIKDEFLDLVISQIVDALPTFILYDSFTGLLPSEIKISDIPSSQAVKDFEKIFGVNFSDAINKGPQERTSIKNAVEEKAELDLNTYWTQKRTDESTEDKYRFNINLLPSGADSRIEFLIHRDDRIPLFMEQKSKGFQWFNAFVLRLKAIGVEDNSFAKYVLLIDEPGQGLHETAQKNVKVVLEELAKKGMEILYTTHNPSLIGVNDDELLRIRLVFQSKEQGTKINTISQFASSVDGASKDALSPIITAMGISHLGQIVDANQVCVVVEGITDHYYFTAFKQLLSVANNHTFIPACGVQNVRPLVSILLGWGAKFKAIFDDGKDGKSAYKDIGKYLFKDDKEGFEKSVKKLDGFDGIEDLFEKDDFYEYVLKEAAGSETRSNSEVAKEKKKELRARLFLEKVRNGEVKKENLKQKTLESFSKALEWLNT
ncbi:MAG: AAA family ATPase [Candidatus Staskawiczbacteria bacterium]|nr:AAA family ATPase [Candidatus Staskawiczbacteria bacterium]